jgi:multicomponent Na+:H+ antiporter subunit G
MEILCVIFILTGLVFFFGAVAGLVRFPDFYTRMHAAGKGDTLSTMLILAGLALHLLHDGFDTANVLVALKIMAICAFIMLTSPTSTHALMQAGYEEGVKPYGADEEEAK